MGGRMTRADAIDAYTHATAEYHALLLTVEDDTGATFTTCLLTYCARLRDILEGAFDDGIRDTAEPHRLFSSRRDTRGTSGEGYAVGGKWI